MTNDLEIKLVSAIIWAVRRKAGGPFCFRRLGAAPAFGQELQYFFNLCLGIGKFPFALKRAPW